MKKLFPPMDFVDFLIWGISVSVLIGSHLLFPSSDLFSTVSSLIGVTALIFVANGAVIGQVLMLVFCVFYGVNSLQYRYYGEAITYLGMSAPAVIFNIVSWIRHPYRDTAQVQVAPVTPKRVLITFILTGGITVLFYFILQALGTAKLLVSTFSVATSLLASLFSFQRSPWYAVAYATNDVVLILLWALTLKEDASALPVLICFAVFLLNDLHGFFSWQKMKKAQSK